jgi:pimeloyl-ACP methyl ester carboxylesterase
MPRAQVHCVGHTPATPDAVWAIAGDFCGRWHPAITTMRAERDAQGRLIRAFRVQGEDTLYREQLTYFSDYNRTMAYAHLAGIAGADAYAAQLMVSEAEGGGSVITMSASLTAAGDRAVEIAAGTKAIFDDGISVLAKLAEGYTGGAKARAPLPSVVSETIITGDFPRLAVSATAARDGPLCLFVHGIGGGRSNWVDQLGVAGSVMRAAAMDLRGYGDSTLGAAQSTVDDYIQDILRVRQVLGADKLVLCGLSYGSWIATSFAMRHPEMLAGLVLSGGCTGMSEAGAREREAFRMSREVPLDAGQTPADFAPTVVQVIAGPHASAPVKQRLFDSMAAIPTATYRDALVCFTTPEERFDFAKLTMPVLLMTGAHDRLAPPDKIKGVADRICDAVAMPDVRYEVIADAGHVCNVEAPDAYNRILCEFLAKRMP